MGMEETPREPPPRSALGIYLGFAAGLAVFFLVLQWIIGRRVIAADLGHEQAIARAMAEPGTPVTDPALPAGVLLVDLVPAAPDLVLGQPATVRAGGKRAAWTPDAPARFEGLPGDRRLPLSINGPYAVESASIAAPTGSRGARVAVRAIPLEPPRPYYHPAGWTPEKRLEADLGRPGMVRLTWLQGLVVVAEEVVPREPRSALAARIRDQWKQQRSHSDVADRKLDQAIFRIGPTDSFEDTLSVVEALLAPRREQRFADEIRVVPAFNVVVQPPFRALSAWGAGDLPPSWERSRSKGWE